MQARNKYLLILLFVALVGFAAFFLSKVLIYLVLALVLSLIGNPLNKALKKVKLGSFHIPGGLSALLSLLFIYSLLAGLIAIFIPLALQESRLLAGTHSSTLIAVLHEPIQWADTQMSRYWPQPFSTARFLEDRIPTLLNAGQISTLANSFVGFTGGLFVAFFAVSFFTFFFLKDGRLIFETLILLSPARSETDIRHILHECKRLLTRYFTGLCIDSFCVATIISLGMYLMGIPNALIIGLFAGIVNVIPYVGFLVATAFGLFVALSTGLSPDFHVALVPMILKVAGVFIGCNLLDSILLQPLIFSNTVKAHPLEIFLVILITGTLAGIGPMILAVPTYTVLRVIARQFLSKFRIVRKLTVGLEERERRQNPQKKALP
jgi:predicted PurR-regulated permease PerM